jgi:hypothetical protein
VLYEKVTNLKTDNQNMNRTITKDKYHNNRDELEKQRRKQMEDIQEEIQKINAEIEAQQVLLEEETERNADKNLLKKEREIMMNYKADHNKIDTDITVAENRIKDLKNRRELLHQAIKDILVDKRKIDKYNMELEDKISGRNVTEESSKLKHKLEERKMRIKYEKNLDNLRIIGVNLMEKTTDEESKSKDVLDQKLKLEQQLVDLKDNLAKLTEQHLANREELIKLRVKNSQLDSQQKSLNEEGADLKVRNTKLTEENNDLEKENNDLKTKIASTIKKIDLNNLLKEIDIEELQLLAKNNKQMNYALENMITKWNVIQNKEIAHEED